MEKSVKMMELIDPYKGTMRCKVCGSTHDASLKTGGNGKYERGSWQCVHKCKPDFNGLLQKYIDK